MQRVLSMYDRLVKGHELKKKEEAELFYVNEKTIQRDFEGIRAFLAKVKMNQSLEYDRKRKIYRLETEREDESFLRNEEILAIMKILIESRAFPKSDMNGLLTKLTKLAQSDNQDFIEKLILNEKHLYVELEHKKSLFTLLWGLSKAIHTRRIIKIRYKKENDKEDRERILKPVGLIFSEYYFYLVAYQFELNLPFPKIYRVDRITECHVTDEHFNVPYRDRFQEGEFRQRIQFMHAGELMRIKLKFTGPSPQAVQDRLPTARIVEKNQHCVIFEAEVFGNGIKMWLLSQGDHIEVLSPKELRDEMKKIIHRMDRNYQD